VFPQQFLITAQPGVLVVQAPAKVNLFLELHGQRADGYHNLETLIVQVDLFDTLAFTAHDTLELRCDDPGLPTDERNLVLKAARLLQQHTGSTAGARMHLQQQIPHEAGLGGGSSDAASTLVALNQLWNLHLPVDDLAGLAGQLGSDVPSFLLGPCWCTGRGEVVRPLPDGPTLNMVLVKPPVGCSTAEVYRRVSLPAVPQSGEAILQAWTQHDVPAIATAMMNRLQTAAFGLQPAVKRLYDAVTAQRPLATLLCGSGSTVLAVLADQPSAARLARRLTDELAHHGGGRVYQVQTIHKTQ